MRATIRPRTTTTGKRITARSYSGGRRRGLTRQPPCRPERFGAYFARDHTCIRPSDPASTRSRLVRLRGGGHRVGSRGDAGSESSTARSVRRCDHPVPPDVHRCAPRAVRRRQRRLERHRSGSRRHPLARDRDLRRRVPRDRGRELMGRRTTRAAAPSSAGPRTCVARCPARDGNGGPARRKPDERSVRILIGRHLATPISVAARRAGRRPPPTARPRASSRRPQSLRPTSHDRSSRSRRRSRPAPTRPPLSRSPIRPDLLHPLSDHPFARLPPLAARTFTRNAVELKVTCDLASDTSISISEKLPSPDCSSTSPSFRCTSPVVPLRVGETASAAPVCQAEVRHR